MEKEAFSDLHHAILNCQHCTEVLPLPPKPILQVHPDARVLIAGHAATLTSRKCSSGIAS